MSSPPPAPGPASAAEHAHFYAHETDALLAFTVLLVQHGHEFAVAHPDYSGYEVTVTYPARARALLEAARRDPEILLHWPQNPAHVGDERTPPAVRLRPARGSEWLPSVRVEGGPTVVFARAYTNEPCVRVVGDSTLHYAEIVNAPGAPIVTLTAGYERSCNPRRLGNWYLGGPVMDVPPEKRRC